MISDEPLVKLIDLHSPLQASSAIVLVLGLDGVENSNHLKGNTGENLGSRLKTDFETSSIYMLSYPSTIRVFMSNKGFTTNTIAEQYAQLVESILFKKYNSIHIISYCLGGFYSLRMLTKLTSALGETTILKPNLSLIMIDVPHYCTSETMENWFVKLIGILRISDNDLKKNMSNWQRYIISEKLGTLKDRTYAIVSRDSWVTPMIPEAFLPSARVFKVDEKHHDLLVEPKQGDWEIYRIISSLITDQNNLSI
jgi:hypothetical protein